jgi:hypothetical protein
VSFPSFHSTHNGRREGPDRGLLFVRFLFTIPLSWDGRRGKRHDRSQDAGLSRVGSGAGERCLASAFQTW